MESGIRISWGKIVPGRETEALGLFDEVMTYFGKKLEKKEITYFEPFFVRTADQEEETGFVIFKGAVPEIFKIMEDEEYLTLLSKAYYTVTHFKVDFLVVGDGIVKQLERTNKVRAEYGF
jgi:hypothetical protein